MQCNLTMTGGLLAFCILRSSLSFRLLQTILIGLAIGCISKYAWYTSAAASIFFLLHFFGSLGSHHGLKPNWTLLKSAIAFRYKKLERYLFHNISLCIPWHTRTHNCSSRNVQHRFHCSDKANWCMETEEERKMNSSCRAINQVFITYSICVAGINQTVTFRPKPPKKQAISLR